MRTESREDPVAATRRRLEEFGRLWSDDRSGTALASDAEVESAPPASPRLGLPGDHRAPGVVPALRLNPRHLGLIAVAAVLFVLVAIWWSARSAPEPMPVADTTPAAAPVSGTGSSAPATASTPQSAAPPSGSPSGSPSGTPAVPEVVVVDVAGKVRRPLVVTLPAGSRVIDAIRKAGGPRPGVDLSGLNLARVLVDGEQVLVGRRSSRPARAGVPDRGGSGSTGAPGAKTDLNSASAAELEELPGVGPVTAAKIIAWRTEHGAFTSAEELLEVDGIGPKTLAEIAPEVTW